MGGMGKIIENVRPPHSESLSLLDLYLFTVASSIEPRLLMLFSLVQKMSWEILVFDKRSVKYQKMHVCKRIKWHWY